MKWSFVDCDCIVRGAERVKKWFVNEMSERKRGWWYDEEEGDRLAEKNRYFMNEQRVWVEVDSWEERREEGGSGINGKGKQIG